MAKNGTRPPAPVWGGADYPRVPEGRYQAMAASAQGPEWVRAFGRWSLRIEFALLDDGSLVSGFYNFGDNREAPRITRGGNYFKAWTLANGELPHKGQAMSPDVFLEGQVFTIEVKDRLRNAKNAQKPDAEIYSSVTEIVAVERPHRGQREIRPAPSIMNHSIRNQLSSNQPIKQSTNQVGQ